MRMKHSIREKWIEALRSGRFRKAQGVLGRPNPDRYCGLGVLCELAIENGVAVERRVITQGDGGTAIAYGGTTTQLPAKVREWAGLTDADPRLWIEDLGFLSNVSGLNDNHRLPLDEIGKLIDEDPERKEDLPD